MKKELHKRINALIEAELKHGIDVEFLDRLRELASEDTIYWNLAPETRNTLNRFFTEVKDVFIAELLDGNYGSQITLDAVIILCFEVGYKLRAEQET